MNYLSWTSKLNFNFDNIRTYFLQVLRGCRQVTFVTLNGFCLLSKKITPLFQTDNIKMDRILTKIFYIVFHVLKILLITICKIQPLDLLFLVFISFNISRYHFSQVFRILFQYYLKKRFFRFKRIHSNPTPHGASHTLNSLNPLSKTSLLSMLPNLSRFFKIIMLLWQFGRTRTAEQN